MLNVDSLKLPPSSPLCSHYPACGGCQLQHYSDEIIKNQKTDYLRNILDTYNLSPKKVYPIQTSPPRTRRRVVFSTIVQNGNVELGFFAQKSHTLIPIDNCLVVTQKIHHTFSLLRKLAKVFSQIVKKNKFLVIDSANGIDIQIQELPVSSSLHASILFDLQQLCNDYAKRLDLARVSINDLPAWQLKTPYETFGKTKVMYPAGAFLQATRHGEKMISTFICHHFKNARSVLDLFSGCGTLSLPLLSCTPSNKRITINAIDNNAKQIKALEQAATENLLKTSVKNLFKNPVNNFEMYDGIIIDPPRAGALAQIRQIAKKSTCPVISVSCNPTTFARDARILCDNNYIFREMLPIDQFRWSNHIEIVGFFTKAVDIN